MREEEEWLSSLAFVKQPKKKEKKLNIFPDVKAQEFWLQDAGRPTQVDGIILNSP